MEYTKNNLIKAAVLSALLLPTTAFATNGMSSIGNGTKAQGMGGAGAALATESGSISTNPAAVVAIGDRLDVSLSLFTPSPRGYELVGNTVPAGPLAGGHFNDNQESENDLFLIPSFGMTFPINDKSAWSIGMAAAGGMNSEYKRNFGSNVVLTEPETVETSMNLEQLFVSGTYGRKLNKDTSVGVSVLYAYQTFRATGLGVFGKFGASETPDKLTDNGNDQSSGLGYKVGVQTSISELQIGIAFQPKITMSKFEKYTGLFANQGEMNIPALFTIGMAWNITPNLLIAFDYQNIDYKGVASIGNSIKKFTDENKKFGSKEGPGFGWNSIDVYKLGLSYTLNSDWTFRTGWNKGENPVTKEEISLAFLAPAVITDHFTLGFTNKINKNSEYSMNFIHSFRNSLSGDFVPTFGGGTMTVDMEQNSLEIAYGKLF